jgi:IS1 family transposase
MLLNSGDAILRCISLLLSNCKLFCGINARLCGVSPRLTGRNLQDVSLGGHFLELTPKNYGSPNDSKECEANEDSIQSRPPERQALKISELLALIVVGCVFGWLACDVLLDDGRFGRRFEWLLWRWRGIDLSEGERFLLATLGFLIVAICGLHFFLIVTRKHLTPLHLCNTVSDMANVLSAEKQTAIIAALAEGSSIRSIERITGVHRDTIMRLGVKVGKGCQTLMDSKMQDLDCHYLQFDELWGFIGKKERHCSVDDNPTLGDVWTFCAIDSETKLVPSFKVGKRTHATTTEFVQDVASRMRNRVQISSDAMHLYVEAMELAFGSDVDYGQCVKVYVHDAAQHPERKYSAPHFASAVRRPITGQPEMELVSTSHVERLNATTRLHMRRLTRLTLAFSKKLENFEAAVALHFAYYNFVKRHNTLRCTPAMAAGVERDFWSVADLVEATA